MRPRLLALAALVATQLAVPLTSITVQQRTLALGTPWKLRTGPVDPYDAFRGRYVALSFPDVEQRRPLPDDVRDGERMWGVLEVGADGFARIGRLERRQPPEDAIPVTVRRWDRFEGAADHAGTGSIELPFDTYWMPEDLAPQADRVYAEAVRTDDEETHAWVTVRVRRGHAALEELWIDGRPIREILRSPSP